VGVRDIYAHVDPARCRFCGSCGEACAYDAPGPTGQPAYEHTWVINAERCKGCGACMAVCPVDAIRMGFYETALYAAQVEQALQEATR